MSDINIDKQIIKARAHYDRMAGLFAHKGWKEFIQEMTEYLDVLKEQAITVGDTSDSDFNIMCYRGQKIVLDKLLSFEAALRNQQENFEEDVEDGTFQDMIELEEDEDW